MHTAAFLREGGRLGYVISSSWLDVSFGAGLQKYLLDHFKIVAIIDHQHTRSFETALVNTIILILERCADPLTREKNNVRFVKVTTEYEKLFGNYTDNERIDLVANWAGEIENVNSDYSNADFSISVVNQKELELFSTIDGKYENGNWGARYFRAPGIYHKLIKASKGNLMPLSSYVDVKYGIKSGANDFFYIIDETVKALTMPDDLYKMQFGIKLYTEIANHKRIWEKFGWQRQIG